MVPDLPGLDIHNGLRIWWDDLTPRFSAEALAGVETGVRAYILVMRQRVEYAERWLAAFRRARETKRG